MSSVLTRGLLIASLSIAAATPALAAQSEPNAAPNAAKAAAQVSPQQSALSFAGLDAKTSDTVRAHFQAQTAEAWAKYEKKVGTPLQTWAKTEVAYPGAGTVFYPFSGPDFLTVARVYPNADRYVLVAIQNARKPAHPEAMAAAQRAAFERNLGTAWGRFGTLGYFRTDDLNDDQRDRANGVGVTTILMAFAARLGYEVTAVAPLAFNADKGEWDVATTDADWKSVRLSLHKDGRKSTLDYIHLDLSNNGLKASEPQLAWIQRMAGKPTLLKAASHLLQEPYFTVLRDALVSSAPLVVQDETGLDYKDLTKVGPVNLYGNFKQTHKLFKTTTQPALAAAYKAEKKTGELPFAFSYLKDERARSMQIARRQGQK